MTDILMLPYDHMTASTHAQAAHETGRSYCVAADLDLAQDHLKAHGQPTLLVIDFANSSHLVSLPPRYIELLQLKRVPAIHIVSAGLNGSVVEREFNCIAGVSPSQQYESVLPDLMSAFFEHLKVMQGKPTTAESFQDHYDEVVARPERQLSLARNQFPLIKLG